MTMKYLCGMVVCVGLAFGQLQPLDPDALIKDDYTKIDQNFEYLEGLIEALTVGGDLPSPIGNAGAVASTDGLGPIWTFSLKMPSAGVQPIEGVEDVIDASRTIVDVEPDDDYTLGTGTDPVIIDGEDGQLVIITNVSADYTVTLPDEANVVDSNIVCGGTDIPIGPGMSALLRYVGETGVWSCVGSAGGGGGLTGNDVRNSVFQCAGTSGSDNYECSITGVSEYTTNMLIYFVADANSSTTGGTSLNVNGLGAKDIYEPNGTAMDHDGAMTAGRGYWLRYDGTRFRLDGAGYAQHAYRSTVAGSGMLKQSVLGTFSLASAGTDYTEPKAKGTATLGTSEIAAGACASAVTVTASGTTTTDAIIWTPNTDISAVTGYGVTGTLRIYPYPTSGNVNFKVCNSGDSAVTPGAVTLNWKVVN